MHMLQCFAMKQVRFCSHAEEKFQILKKHGFTVTKKMVLASLKDPDKVERGYAGRWVVQKAIDKKHVLRIVYEKRPKACLVITFYPGRRDYYES